LLSGGFELEGGFDSLGCDGFGEGAASDLLSAGFTSDVFDSDDDFSAAGFGLVPDAP
jgi:hypothetical protein